MNLRILGTALLPLGLLLTSAPQAEAQSFPARQLDGRLCVIDLRDFGDVDVDEPVQDARQSRKLCTGGDVPNVILVCSGPIEGWPARTLNARDNFSCQISVRECGIDSEEPLVEATSKQLTINRNGSARLQCTYRQ